MVKRIKNKIKEFENRFRKLDKANGLKAHNQELIKSNQQLLFDYTSLSRLFSNDEYIPLTKYSISPSTIVHILNDILLNNKKNIIEFGSGSSTLYIAKFIKSLQPDVIFYSIESDEDWLKKIKCLAQKYDVLDNFYFIHVPLADIDQEFGYKNQSKWYNTKTLQEVLNSQNKFDLVLVDGPVGLSSPYARYSAIPFLINKLSNNFSIYLDDTFRKEEKEIIIKWGKLLELDVKNFGRYSLISREDKYDCEPFGLKNM